MVSKGTRGKNGWKTGKDFKSQLDLMPKGYLQMDLFAVTVSVMGFIYALSNFL